MNFYGFSSLFNGIVVLCTGFYLLSRQRQNRLYQSFAAFSASVGLWCVFYAVWQMQTSKDVALFCNRLLMFFCYFIPFTFLWFVFNLVGWKWKRWHSLPLTIPPLVFALFSFTPLMTKGVAPKLDFPFWPEPGFLMHFFVGIFIGVVIFSFWVLWRAYGTAEGLRRRQIKWVGLTLLPGWIGGATNWFLWYDIPIPPVAHFFVGITFLILFFVIIRGRLFDIDAITDLIQEAKLSTLGVIASSINHEVRNPLYVIKGLAETLLEKAPVYDHEKIKEIAQRTITQSDRALGIIRNFSAYAKRETGKVYEKQPVRIKELIERILPFVESELKLKGTAITQEIPEDITALADRQSLEEIFLNLIINACQAIQSTNKQGEIKVTAKAVPRGLQQNAVIASRGDGEAISTVRSPRPQDGLAMTDPGKIIITIQDTGPGILPENQNRIFEPFYTTKSSGTGLGLYVVKQLVDKNGGKIEVRSKPGAGATFVVLLPLTFSIKT